MKDYIIAHDVGTTGNKAALYDREGRGWSRVLLQGMAQILPEPDVRAYYEKPYPVFNPIYDTLVPVNNMIS